jgi:hypothetical protein
VSPIPLLIGEDLVAIKPPTMSGKGADITLVPIVCKKCEALFFLSLTFTGRSKLEPALKQMTEQMFDRRSFFTAFCGIFGFKARQAPPTLGPIWNRTGKPWDWSAVLCQNDRAMSGMPSPLLRSCSRW